MWGTFLAGLVLFMVSVLIVSYYQGALNPRYHTFLLIAAPISGIALIIMGYRLFKGRMDITGEGDQLYEKMENYRSAMVIRMILLDGAAFIQLVAFVMSADKVFIALSLVIATLFMLYKPSLERFIKDMNLSELEAQVMRDHA